jgi:hypothetical protein
MEASAQPFSREKGRSFAEMKMMSGNLTTRDKVTGRFLTGGKPGPGRPRGSRNLLAEDYLNDLRSVWSTHGRAALIAAAEQEPARFCQIFASLLPREIDVDISVVAIGDALAAYRLLRSMPQAELRKLHESQPDAAD